jgi:peptide/nickel transport system permease protein
VSAPTPPPPVAPVGGRRPSPQIAQLKRTLYFFSRSTLAVVGLAVIIFFILIAIGGLFYPAPSLGLQDYCGTTTSSGQQNVSLVASTCPGPVICTYPNTAPPPQLNCYPVDQFSPSLVGPTVDLSHFTLGPLPFGSLSIDAGGSLFFNPFAGLIKGAQWSMSIAFGIVASGAMIGLLLGATAGYFGGIVDEVVMRLTDIFLSIPGFLLVLVIIASVGATISTLDGRILVLMGAFIVTWWPLYTRIVRGQVLVTREQKFVEASKASGARSGRMILRHIIPNSMYPIFVQMSLDVGAIPLALGGIVFLGFQIFPTEYFPEWGTIAALGVQIIPSELVLCSGGTCVFPWWQILFPGITLFLFAISVNFLSDGLRDALDPRLRR